MIADRSNPVRTVSRTKWATCPEGTKSWIDGGSSQTWSTSQARNVLLIPRLNHDAPSSSRKIRLLGQAPRRRRPERRQHQTVMIMEHLECEESIPVHVGEHAPTALHAPHPRNSISVLSLPISKPWPRRTDARTRALRPLRSPAKIAPALKRSLPPPLP